MSCLNLTSVMQSSGVQFGTSGARGLAAALTDQVAYLYTTAFLNFLRETSSTPVSRAVAVAGDLRPSTGRIMSAVSVAIEDCGMQVITGGTIPSPALTLFGMEEGIPTIMVTGSHIPSDRNGIKFTKPNGELTKADEVVLKQQEIVVRKGRFNAKGELVDGVSPRAQLQEIESRYLKRYLDVFSSDALKGLSIGIYQHSAVGRDLLVNLCQMLGATVTPLGRSSEFIPVDTEAIRAEDKEKARAWATEAHFDAIISTDGDSDRPLISDEAGKWIRGDIAGILTAQLLKADGVATPVSCNTALEKLGIFPKIVRTRIGSPYVIAGMQEAEAAGAKCVVGYEANGGFLIQTPVMVGRKTLAALPTRDAVIVHLMLLTQCNQDKIPLSALVQTLPMRATASDRLENFPNAKSQDILARLSVLVEQLKFTEIASQLHLSHSIRSADLTDGVRLLLESNDIVHLRGSGNAPEFRCYTESDTVEHAEVLLAEMLNTMRELS